MKKVVETTAVGSSDIKKSSKDIIKKNSKIIKSNDIEYEYSVNENTNNIEIIGNNIKIVRNTIDKHVPYLDPENEYFMLFNSIYRVKRQYIFIDHNTGKWYICNNKSELESQIKLKYPEFTHYDKRGKKQLSIDNEIIDDIAMNNDVEMISEQVNLFQDLNYVIQKKEKDLVITRKYTGFIRVLDYNIEDDIYEECITDFKEHFEEIDEVLEWTVACRFTNNRRSSFSHLHFPAGFGKSKLASIFKDMGIATIIDYEDFRAPSPLSSKDFHNSLVLIIDEFTIFKQAMKKLTNEISFDSKGLLKQSVEVFAKLFLSAEQSVSFSGGVDSQISDRVNQISKKGSMKYDLRPMKIKHKVLYDKSIEKYISSTFKKYFEDFMAMGEIDSANTASAILAKYHTKNKINDDIAKVIAENIFDRISGIYVSDNQSLSHDLLNIKKEFIYQEDHIIIKSPANTFEKILQTYDKGFSKKASFKTADEILEFLEVENKSHWFANNTKKIRGVKLERDFLIKYNLGEVKDYAEYKEKFGGKK